MEKTTRLWLFLGLAAGAVVDHLLGPGVAEAATSPTKPARPPGPPVPPPRPPVTRPGTPTVPRDPEVALPGVPERPEATGPVVPVGGTTWAKTLPAGPGPAREAAILEQVKLGNFDHGGFEQVQIEHNGMLCIASVWRRALAIGNPYDRMIFSVDYVTQERIARLTGCTMLTSKVADEVYRQARVKLAPITRPWSQDGTMAKTNRMIQQAFAIEQAVAEADGLERGLVANEGKHWIVTKRFWNDPDLQKRKNSCNYGWHVEKGGVVKPIQGVGCTHDKAHTDYSQLCVLMKNEVIVDGRPMSVAEVLRSPELHPLLSNEGPLPLPHHPDFAKSESAETV